MTTSRTLFSLLGVAALAAATMLPASAQTLTFDDLPAEQGIASDANPITMANGGSRLYDGVTFNSTAQSDWEVIGNQFVATGLGGYYGTSHSGDYYLSGNAYFGQNNLGQQYTGLTISTNKVLTSFWAGVDNIGGGDNDSTTLTLSALGAGGTVLATISSPNNLINPADITTPVMNFFDTSGVFGSLTGITGYLFETDARSLHALQGQGYVNADDLTFKDSNPVPEASTTISFGLLLCLGLGGVVLAARKKRLTA